MFIKTGICLHISVDELSRIRKKHSRSFTPTEHSTHSNISYECKEETFSTVLTCGGGGDDDDDDDDNDDDDSQ